MYSELWCIKVVIYLIIAKVWGGCSCAKLYDSNPINFNLLGFTIFANVWSGLCYFPEVDKYRSEQFSNLVQRFTLNTAHCTDHNSMLMGPFYAFLIFIASARLSHLWTLCNQLKCSTFHCGNIGRLISFIQKANKRVWMNG